MAERPQQDMAKIDEIKEQRIKDAANIMDVLTYDLGVQLHRSGSEYTGLCPFHNDRHLGSFKVSESKNIATCFSCGRTWNPIDALMEGLHMDYPTALRHLAARYNIWLDDQPAPKVTPAKPRKPAPELPIICWSIKDLVRPTLGHEDKNPLLQYLYSLPLQPEHMVQLDLSVRKLYLVGTSTTGETEGWTIWWQIDEKLRVRTGKLMAYKSDGHREKGRKYSFNFAHSLLAKAGQWSPDEHRVVTCLFGLHLLPAFPNAEVCIVESEKSALICSAFTDPNKRLWMATAGKSQLTREKLLPLIEAKRYIVLYPDYDGYDEWEAAAKRIGYDRISVSNQVRKYHVPADGDKADIADIMLRLVSAPQETEKDVAARRLGLDSCPPSLSELMDKLDLTTD